MSASGHRTTPDHQNDPDKRDLSRYDPVEEQRHWHEAHRSRPYIDPQYGFDDYGPAYRYGGESWLARSDRRAAFADVEHELGVHWDRVKDQSRLGWDKAREAVRDAWERAAERFGRADLRADDDGMAPDPQRAAKKGPRGDGDLPNDDKRPML